MRYGEMGAPTPKIYKPNTIVDYIAFGDKIDKRIFYDSQGRLIKQIHTNNHSRPKSHPYGVNGEHAHDFEWRNGDIIGRTIREISDEEYFKNQDILPKRRKE